MAEVSQLIQHIESFVNTSCSPSQQAASLDAIATLIKNDIFTIGSLVREMDMYLTTTDAVIRGRGIFLLAELLRCLASNPLDNATIHSLIGFFTDRLADWKAIRGALVGCLALLRRKSNAGVVSVSDARAVAQSYLQNLNVQDLGQADRKLCYKIMECLLICYPNAVAELGDQLLDGICSAIDGEKDPQCLMLTFHVVEVLAQLFPDPMGSPTNIIEELAEILGCYFPIHFTHQKTEDIGVTRDDLSKALMLAFTSTPLFAPFMIPMLLEKLSSSLPAAKIDSLKYLNNYMVKYGIAGMETYSEAIWSSLKDAICTSQGDPIFYLSSEFSDSLHFQENEIAKEALVVLQNVITQSNGSFTSYIVADDDINKIINSIASLRNYHEISLEGRQNLHVVGCILYVSAKTSIPSCSKVFEGFFLRIMDSMGLLVKDPSKILYPIDDNKNSNKHNFGALYLCIEFLGGCRDLVVACKELTLNSVSAHEAWTSMISNFSQPLASVFSSNMVTSQNEVTHDGNVYTGVKGMQILATFPGSFSPVSKSIYEDILIALTSIVTREYNHTLLWQQALKALVSIGSFVERYQESDKEKCFMYIVVEKIITLISLDDVGMPIPLKLEAICSIGATGLNYMLKIVQGFEGAIFANLSDVSVEGNMKSTEVAVQLLEYYTNKVLPWFQKTGGSEEVSSRFAINIWNHIENSMSLCNDLQNELLVATMNATKLAVGNCSEECQSAILEKAYSVISCSTSFSFTKSLSDTNLPQFERIQLTQDLDSFTRKDELLISLFASSIIPVRPQARIPNLIVASSLFMKALLKGHVPSAQALGSLVNKLPLKTNQAETSGDCTLEELLNMIFSTIFCGSFNQDTLRRCIKLDYHSETGLNEGLLSIFAINGLAWIGKGLLMRGHDKAKDIIMIFLKCLVSNGETEASTFKHISLENSIDQRRAAADAFHILISESEICLNRKFHAVIRPLYQQRFFSIVIPIMLSSIMKSDSLNTRYMLYRAFVHVISSTPLVAILSESKKLIPIMLDGLSMLSEDVLDKDSLYSLLLVLSGLLTDTNGQEAVHENAHIIINRLTKLVSYPYMMVVRETTVQCLAVLSGLPHTRIYPMRSQVVQAISKALDDPRRGVREEAVRCLRSWGSIA